MMKQKLTMHRRATGLLLAAAALPFTPAFAQDTTTTQPPVVDVSPPPVTTPAPEETVTPTQPTPTTTTAPTPTVSSPPPTISTTRPVTTAAPTVAPVEEAAPARRTTRAATRTTTTRTRASAPAAAPAAPAPVAETVATPDAAAPIAAAPPETLPAPEALPVDTATAPAEPVAARNIPWMLLGVVAVLLAGLIAFFAFRRRRTRDEVYDDYREEAVYEQPVAEPVAEPAMAAPLATTDADEAAYAAPVAATAAAAAAVEEGEPQIEFEMRPRRAGVGEDDAKVEFALGVVNRGNAPARDVRVSAWMLGAGSPNQSEAERALIDHVDIGAGEDANVEASVALPRSGLSEDAILPVVVTEARYTRPDGSEGLTTASYAVGVPDGEEMMHFDVENPSGLHDGVVARPVDELERA